MTRFIRSMLLACAALIALVSCEGESGGEALGLAGSVRGEVRYAGSYSGALKVAVFSSFPPRGAPIAMQEIAEPRFPQAYTVQGLPPGRYFVLAILDTEPNDGDHFRPSVDPGGASGGFLSPTAVTVDAVQGAGDVHVELVDPDPASPWIRAGYR